MCEVTRVEQRLIVGIATTQLHLPPGLGPEHYTHIVSKQIKIQWLFNQWGSLLVKLLHTRKYAYCISPA